MPHEGIEAAGDHHEKVHEVSPRRIKSATRANGVTNYATFAGIPPMQRAEVTGVTRRNFWSQGSNFEIVELFCIGFRWELSSRTAFHPP